MENIKLDTYVVKSGDTLMKIAKEQLGDANRYMEIAKLNNISDPDIINPGEKFKLPSDTSQTVETLDLINEEINVEDLTKQETKVNTETEKIKENSPTKDINLNNIKEGTKVSEAIKKYGDELKNADYATVNENLYLTTTTDYINDEEVKVTHIVINDPSQINGSPANGKYATGLETATSAATRLNSSLLINGSHFDYSDGSEDLKGANNIVIVNGEIKKDGYSGGNELLIDNTGKIFNAYGKSAQELVNAGVKYSFSCHSTQVIENGDTSPSYREGNLYKRNVIGMTKPCEYYIVTDTTYNNALHNTAEYLKGKGCTNAFSLDQGGSVSLVRNNDLLNNPSEGKERAVGDFLYFTS